MSYIGEHQKWNINIDPNYEPTLTIIISTYNEEKVIERRLENLLNVDYPRNKIEIIHIDSASTDSTYLISTNFVKMHPEINIKIVEEDNRLGKGKALNNALSYAKNDIIVTSDADSFFYPDTLRKIVKYLADQNVAAVTGREVLLNPDQSSLTQMESTYLNTMYKIKLGESKLDSMIIFQGELSAYKRQYLTGFEEYGGDDSPTALELVQKGYKTIFAPDAFFYDATPSTFEGKSKTKIRRGQHQILLWLKCLNLLIKGKLKLNPWIALGEILFFIIDPILLLISLLLTILAILYYPILLLIFIAVTPLFLFKVIRNTIQGYIIGNFTLLVALFRIISGDKNIIWEKVDETRREFK